jgi:hypothetical protein
MLSSLEASIGSLLVGVGSSFSSVALNAIGCASDVDTSRCSKLVVGIKPK